MEISEEILEFFDSGDVQNALAANDFKQLYVLAESRFAYRSLVGELTSVLMQAGVDPLQGMTEIPEDFLYDQENITEFNIPEGITKIGRSAFEDTNLESVTIPGSVKEIEAWAFAFCEGLKSVNLPAGIQLDKGAFVGSGLESIELRDVKLQGSSIFPNCTQLGSVVIKGSTPEVPSSTFINCINLTHVELPASLKKIGWSSFYSCSELKEINFEGTTEQWKNIKIDRNNLKLFNCRVVCSDGTLKYDKTTKEWIEI